MTTTPPADPFGIHDTVDQLKGLEPLDPDQIRRTGTQRVRNRRVASVAGLAVCAILAGVGIANLGHLGSNSKPDIAIPPSTSPVSTSAPTSGTPTPSATPTQAPSTSASTPTVTSTPTSAETVDPSSSATPSAPVSSSTTGPTVPVDPPASTQISDATFPTGDELYFVDPGDSKRTILPANESESTYLNCVMIGGDATVGTEPVMPIRGKMAVYEGRTITDSSAVVTIDEFKTAKEAKASAMQWRQLLSTCVKTPEGRKAKMQLLSNGVVPVTTQGVSAYQVAIADEVASDGSWTTAEAVILTSGTRVMVAFWIGKGAQDWNCTPAGGDVEVQCPMASRANGLAAAIQR